MTDLLPTHPDLVYARLGDRALALDLYLPETAPAGPVPLMVWIHGGAWRVGDKRWCQEALPLLQDGYAVASVGYRLSQEAVFPAQIRDVKAAVRWLRAHADQWGLDPARFAAGGASAGGHLAALLGVSFYVRDWDRVGEYSECAPEEVSSAVQAVVDMFGPTDFLRMNDEPGEMDHFAPDSPESQLLGVSLAEQPERAAAAAASADPTRYVYPGFPSFLILHGDQDRTVLPNQSLLLDKALRKWWVRSDLVLIHGAGHGFTGEQARLALEKTRAFLSHTLREDSQPRLSLYACTRETLRPRTRHAVRWLNPYEDYELARSYWQIQPGQDLTRKAWLAAHETGYSYAAVTEGERIVSLAGVLRFSDVAWELSAVSTLDPADQRKGYAKSACSFVTKYILGAGKIATTSTRADNIAMQRTAESIGYWRV